MIDASLSLVVILFSKIGVNENRFSSRDTHIISGLVDEITIAVDKVKVLYIISFVRFA